MPISKKLRKKHFILFTHYGIKHDSLSTRAGKELILQRFKNRCQVLKQIIDGHSGYEGHLYIFLDLAWPGLVNKSVYDYRNLQELVDLTYLKASLQQTLASVCRGIEKQIRIVAPDDLLELIESLQKRSKTLGQFLVGGLQGMTYDAPKVVEAVIRIAHFGRTVPILRFDDDVLFASRGGRLANKHDQGKLDQLRNGIGRLVDEYWRRVAIPTIDYFLFSGGYLDLQTQRKVLRMRPPRNWEALALNGFATRILPCYSPEIVAGQPQANKAAVRQFLKDMDELGAPPLLQLTSGAGLCMSDSAIIDLPPFSNMRQYLMWIDDHLKYALHDELGHFANLNKAPGTRRRARIDDAIFPQSRYQQGIHQGDLEWTSREYIPRLLLGSVVDCWLRDPTLKKQGVDNVRRAGMRTSYGRFLQAWVEDAGNRRVPKRARDELESAAYQRLTRIADCWSQPVFEGTLLWHFVTGNISVLEKSFRPADMQSGLFRNPTQALKSLRKVPNRPKVLPKGNFSPGIQKAVRHLAEDFLQYANWVLFWPQFVQAVRWLPPDQHDLRRPFDL